MHRSNAQLGTLHHIVAVLGGDLYAGGRRANVPAPGHSRADRSVSLLLSEGRLVVHSFGAATWQEVLDDLRARGLLDEGRRLVGASGSAPAAPAEDLPHRADRIAAAERLWREGGSIRAGSAAALYGATRGFDLTVGCGALRAHSAAPAAVYRPGARRHPALLAAAHDACGRLTAIEVSYLTEDGHRRRMRTPRKLVGVYPAGSAVRLSPPAATMLVAEGLFTTLSAMRLFGLPGWALLSAHNLARWTPPSEVREVVIAADPGAAGGTAALRLQAALRNAGLRGQVRPPPWGYEDWNALHLAGHGRT
ncbi:DUF7146 domain-containing protein [Phenylobacterium sp. VNQ135]|uniref:DUF7146 domain-containing protein n=1 Tax=Phenylobacterium sp. VNQ135 TaxID=3400922 RepID=UPI003C076B08